MAEFLMGVFLDQHNTYWITYVVHFLLGGCSSLKLVNMLEEELCEQISKEFNLNWILRALFIL